MRCLETLEHGNGLDMDEAFDVRPEFQEAARLGTVPAATNQELFEVIKASRHVVTMNQPEAEGHGLRCAQSSRTLKSARPSATDE